MSCFILYLRFVYSLIEKKINIQNGKLAQDNHIRRFLVVRKISLSPTLIAFKLIPEYIFAFDYLLLVISMQN